MNAEATGKKLSPGQVAAVTMKASVVLDGMDLRRAVAGLDLAA